MFIKIFFAFTSLIITSSLFSQSTSSILSVKEAPFEYLQSKVWSPEGFVVSENSFTESKTLEEHVPNVSTTAFDDTNYFITKWDTSLGDGTPVSYTHLTLPTIYSV